MAMTEIMDEPAEEQAMRPDQFVALVTQSENIAADLEDDRKSEIAQDVIDDYKLDKTSMASWAESMDAGLELAKLIKEEAKSYPFEGSADIKYPLITSAALKFNAKAYPAIVPADQFVKTRTFGADPQGAKAARGERVSAHMSWQLSSQIEEWEEDTDNLLMMLPIVGTMVRKVWYDITDARPRSRLIEPGKFIVNDKVKSLLDAPRLSEEIALYPIEIKARERGGQFLEIEYTAGADKDAPQEFVEQHRRVDLDDDGYAEPYIVTVHVETQKIVRMIADFDADDVRYETEQVQAMVPAVMPDPQTGQPVQVGQMPGMQEIAVGIKKINRNSYFVAYKFMPGIDGGFHGTGLGLLLRDVSETINSLMNMMLDAGHYAALGGGFIGAEARLKGGAIRFKPGEWKMINSRGGDLRQAMVPMTLPGADAVLFQMLGLLTDAGREIAGVQDIMESGKANMPATTTIALIDEGMRVFTAAYKRIFRALKQEFKLLARINATTVSPEEYNEFHDGVDPQGQPIQYNPKEDYAARDLGIEPVADPNSITKQQNAAKAQLLLQMAGDGLVAPGPAAMRVLEAADIADVEELFPQPDPAQQQMEQQMQGMQFQAAQADLAQKMADIEKTLAEVGKLKTDAMSNLDGVELDKARLRFDTLAKILEASRDGIKIAIEGRPADVAGQSGNGSNSGSDGQGTGNPQGGAVGGLLGGATPAGSIPNGGGGTGAIPVGPV